MMYTNKCTVALPTKDTTSEGTFVDVVDVYLVEALLLTDVINIIYLGKYTFWRLKTTTT